MGGDDVKPVISILAAVECACIMGGGILAPANASQMINPISGPEEIVADMVRIHDVVLDGTVLQVDSYHDRQPPPFDTYPRSLCSVLHVRVREYLRGSGPDTVRLVFGAAEVPGKIMVSSAYGAVHVPRVGEKAVFWLAWWEQETAEVFSAGQIWTRTPAGDLFVPGPPRAGELVASADSNLAGVPSKRVISMIRDDARSLTSCYRLVRGEHAERLQRLTSATEDCKQ
jgi:hypothetical protein